ARPRRASICTRGADGRVSRTDIVALPFCNLRLSGRRPPVLPRGYPHEALTLGRHIRKRRMDLGLTQHTLSVKLGCSYTIVATWERDESVPLPWRWPAIEALLGPGLVPELMGLS